MSTQNNNKPQFKLAGGSASKPVNEYKHGFFHDDADVKTVGLSVKNEIKRARILPAFNFDLDADSAEFATSFVPFMTADKQFSSWFFYVPSYVYFGSQKRHFISPLAFIEPTARYSSQGVDPVHDCYKLAHRRKLTNLLQSAVKNESPILPRAKDSAMLNLYVQLKSGVTGNMVGIATQTFMADLETIMGWRAGRNDAIINPNFPDLLFGDLTDPLSGFAFTVVEAESKGNKSFKYACPQFSEKTQSLDGADKFSIDPSTPAGKKILAGRWNFTDVTSVTKVATYAELLDYIVKNTDIPYDLICDACGSFVETMPEKPKSANKVLRRDQAVNAAGGQKASSSLAGLAESSEESEELPDFDSSGCVDDESVVDVETPSAAPSYNYAAVAMHVDAFVKFRDVHEVKMKDPAFAAAFFSGVQQPGCCSLQQYTEWQKLFIKE